MDAILCDHCKAAIDHDAQYFDVNLKVMKYIRVPDALGYMTQSDSIQKKATIRIHLCTDCGNKILHGCGW